MSWQDQSLLGARRLRNGFGTKEGGKCSRLTSKRNIEEHPAKKMSDEREGLVTVQVSRTYSGLPEAGRTVGGILAVCESQLWYFCVGIVNGEVLTGLSMSMLMSWLKAASGLGSVLRGGSLRV